MKVPGTSKPLLKIWSRMLFDPNVPSPVLLFGVPDSGRNPARKVPHPEQEMTQMSFTLADAKNQMDTNLIISCHIFKSRMLNIKDQH